MIPFRYKFQTLAAKTIDLRDKYPFEEYTEIAVADIRPKIGISKFRMLASIDNILYTFVIKGKPKIVSSSYSYSVPLNTLYKAAQVVYKNLL